MPGLVPLARAIAARIRVMGSIGMDWDGMGWDGMGWEQMERSWMSWSYLAPPALTQAVVKASTLTSLTSSGCSSTDMF